MAQRLKFAYDKHADILDISLGKPKAAISREVEDDFFVRLDPKTHAIVGFSILNFAKWFKDLQDVRPVPVTAKFALASTS